MILQTRKSRLKRGMLPKWILSIKGKTCYPKLLVHQDMTRNQPFMKKIRRDNSSKM